MEISVCRNQFDGSVHFADVSRVDNAMKTKTNQHINEGEMDSWSNKQGVIERYTRGRLAFSGGTMLLAHSMHGEVENLVRGSVGQ